MKKRSRLIIRLISIKLISAVSMAFILACFGPVYSTAAYAASREQDVAKNYNTDKAESIAKEQESIFEKGTEPEYMLESGDVIEVAVWRNEDLSRTLTIRPDGRISLPLAGEIKAGGLSPGKLSKVIAARLQNKYILDPQVTVIVNEVGSKNVLVLGEVNNPGLYTISKRLTALEAIGKSGGNAKYAYLENTVIIRNPYDKVPHIFTADLKSVLKEGKVRNDVVLQPGDIVYVPRTFIGKMDDLFSFFGRTIKPIADTYLIYKISED
ncbi:MAG: polysaccharide biosynthesis/export family protein [Candidatus Omnitrophica bacterium]|nr:polysaccharide biosynthesis/export family protein [Candidatus Omnitrophota bacterium]